MLSEIRDERFQLLAEKAEKAAMVAMVEWEGMVAAVVIFIGTNLLILGITAG